MNLSKLVDSTIKVAKAHGPEILTALGVTGVITTSYLSAKAGYETARLQESGDPYDPLSEKIKQSWRLYIPAALSGAGTIACIIYAGKGHSARTAAAVTAYSVTEKAYSEYREKMIQETSEKKDQKILDAVAQDHVSANPPSGELVILGGRDEVLCCELYTGRYFRSSVEKLRKVENDINVWLINTGRCSLSDFYNLLGLPATDVSDKLGWDVNDELLTLEYSYVGKDDEEPGQPCLAFRYNYVKPLE